mmetsp:Transcript_29634/g.52895  ORF Transcript_29634/g.52895 Transcript_29634/m.52895 type:complete len:106 (-) Transcript_29634:695-1012(-)
MVGWEQPLFGCLQDLGSCLVVACVPGGACYCQATSVSLATGDSCIVPCLCIMCLGCIGAAINRSSIRNHYIMEGSIIGDCLVHCLCGPCAICQEVREVRTRENKT